jgi:hypothetical protein
MNVILANERIEPDARPFAKRIGLVAPGSEALSISCSAVRAAGIIGEIEARLGVPVISSKSATAWNVLRVSGGGGAPVACRPMTCDLDRSNAPHGDVARNRRLL